MAVSGADDLVRNAPVVWMVRGPPLDWHEPDRRYHEVTGVRKPQRTLGVAAKARAGITAVWHGWDGTGR